MPFAGDPLPRHLSRPSPANCTAASTYLDLNSSGMDSSTFLFKQLKICYFMHGCSYQSWEKTTLSIPAKLVLITFLLHYDSQDFAADPFFLLAGPNVIESEEHVLRMAKHIKNISSKHGLQLIFKSSFDKANRTSSKSFRGPGLEEGLKILEKVKIAYDLPIVTDVHETQQCEAVGRVADIIQIPAFLCRQTDLLVAAAKTGKIVNIKKGQFCASSVMANSAEKIRLAGNDRVMVCERGTMFGYNDLIVDPRNLEWMREANCPVVADITHSLQQPAGRKLEGGGVASGGLRELIPCIARTAVAVGVDGIFMEVHDDPLNAPVDGPTQWPLRHLDELLAELIDIARASKGKQTMKIDLTPFGEP